VRVHAIDGDDVGEALVPWSNVESGDLLLVAGDPWRVELVVQLPAGDHYSALVSARHVHA
jgi:hypothetical protein